LTFFPIAPPAQGTADRVSGIISDWNAQAEGDHDGCTGAPIGDRPKLLGRDEVAEGTMAFYFDKPSGFDFKPGQSADLTLFNPPETGSSGNIIAGNHFFNTPLSVQDPQLTDVAKLVSPKR
jgi:hypothetical protein